MAQQDWLRNVTQSSEIASKANFDHIRYAQLWEDADVLCAALPQEPGKTLVSICSAGDNALAMLTLDPARVVVVDLSPAQIACLHLRIGAYKTLRQPEFLELTPLVQAASASSNAIFASFAPSFCRWFIPRKPLTISSSRAPKKTAKHFLISILIHGVGGFC